MSSPRPIAPSSGTPATSVTKRTQRVHWMQRFIEVLIKGADELVVDGALVLGEARRVGAVTHRLILQIAFAALVADRTVERMVDEEELHHPLARLARHRRIGEHDRRLAVRAGPQVLDRHGAGRGRLRRPALHFDQAHSAVARDRKPFVEAEPRHLGPGRLASLEKRIFGGNVDFLAVDDDLAHALLAAWPARQYSRRSVTEPSMVAVQTRATIDASARLAFRAQAREIGVVDRQPDMLRSSNEQPDMLMSVKFGARQIYVVEPRSG